MAKRQTRYDANLPRNLTYRKRRKSFYWRNPITGEEFNLGAVARRDAISQAIEANHYIESNFTPVALMQRLIKKKDDSEPATTFMDWMKSYEAILKRRDLADNTIKARTKQIGYLCNKYGKKDITKITTKDIAEFINSYIDAGKNTTASTMRSLLVDIFREAIANGIATNNPAEVTKSPNVRVRRKRLTLDMYLKIHSAACANQPAWVGLGMLMALVTGQRREDICELKKSDIREERLWVIQGKTGAQISIPLDLKLNAVNLTLRNVIEQCMSSNNSEYLVGSDSRKTGRVPGALHPDTLTKAFVTARKNCGLTFTDSPPTFHEIRSLAGRLYEKEYGKEFAQKLFGHKSMKMTATYLDTRENDWTML
ncbi:tyrosine-type recombinase/integrase [Dickeya zeae]|uniref:site-specific integrase n=1 Tax=Dickeya zeae TaxID=204042 RepID=UPI001CFB22C0|nr:tyrosine-type recombinase/integrase [Dickeya zeae]UCZ75374.1 tyrosine-type recombinase/integrase [Dickeya zeae]